MSFYITKNRVLGFVLSISLGLFFSVYIMPQRVSAQANPAGPTCFNHSGTTSRPCQNAAQHNLQPNRCYTEIVQGPNGTLTGYSETSCLDPTDRDMDEPRPDVPNCYNHSGTEPRPCQGAAAADLIPGRCYTEIVNGPSGTLTGYSETSCTDRTDRDMDGDGAGATQPEADCIGETLSSQNCAIIRHVANFIRVLSATAGVVITTMIAYAGVQYTMSRDNPEETSQARQRIRNSLIALIVYVFMFAFLQYVVPGGIL